MAKRLGCWPCDVVALGSNSFTCYSLVCFFLPQVQIFGCALYMANWLPPASFQFVQIALEKAPLGK